jgi:hypothetical protein
MGIQVANSEHHLCPSWRFDVSVILYQILLR